MCVFALVYVFSIRSSSKNGFEVTELVTLRWGAGPLEVGKGVGRDGKTYGPRSFAVDMEGRVTIVDTYNGRVVQCHSTGALMGTRDVAGAGPNGTSILDDVAISRDGTLFLPDSSARKICLLRGSTISTIPFPDVPSGIDTTKGDVPIFVGLWVSKGEIYLNEHYSAESGYFSYLWVYELNEARWKPFSPLSGMNLDEGSERPVGCVSVGVDGLVHYLMPGTGSSKYQLLVYSGGGKMVRSLPLSGLPTGAHLLGVDGKSAVYLAKRDEGKLELWKFDKKGTTLSHLDLPWEDPIPSAIWARVDRAGNLYLARGDEQGFHLFRLHIPATSKIRGATPSKRPKMGLVLSALSHGTISRFY